MIANQSQWDLETYNSTVEVPSTIDNEKSNNATISASEFVNSDPTPPHLINMAMYLELIHDSIS